MTSNSNKSQKTNLEWNNSPDGKKYIQTVSRNPNGDVRNDFPVERNQTDYKAENLPLSVRIGTSLPQIPYGNDENFGGYLWNRVLDGDVAQNIDDYAGGLLDGFSLGITKVIRGKLGIKTNEESISYKVGDKVSILTGNAKNLLKIKQGISIETAQQRCAECSIAIKENMAKLLARQKIGSGVFDIFSGEVKSTVISNEIEKIGDVK